MILKSELIEVVNNTLSRGYDPAGTEMDNKITSALKDLSKRGNFLTEESTRETLVDRPYYSTPTHYKAKLLVMIDDYYPLEWETFRQYQQEISISNTTGYPLMFSKMNKFYYLRPTPDAIYTLRQFFACYHPEIISVDGVDTKACDSILFDDIYRQALELRLIWTEAVSLNLTQKAAEYFGYYMQDEIPSLLINIDEDPAIANMPS